MNILHVVHSYYPSIGGTETSTRELSIELAKRRNRVWVFTTDTESPGGFFTGGQCLGNASFIDSGVNVFRFHVNTVPFARSLKKLNSITYVGIREKSIFKLDSHDHIAAFLSTPLVPKLFFALSKSNDLDIVNSTPYPYGYHLFLNEICQKKKIPFVITPRTHTLDKSFERQYLIRIAKKANALIVFTEYERDYFVAKGVDQGKIFVTGIGVHQEKFRTSDTRSRKLDHGFPEESKVVLFIGRMMQSKGISIALESMKKVWKKTLKAYLVILGRKTSYTPIIEDMARTEKRIILIPNASEKQKIEALSYSDVLVNPSEYESFGRVFLEGWSSGKPVVGARTPVTESIISEGDDGLLFSAPNSDELADKISFLLKHEEIAKAMGNKGREKVLKNYTWERIVGKTSAVYNQLLQ